MRSARKTFVGPYALQDFNLYYTTRYGFCPVEDRLSAWHAWRGRERGRLAVGYRRRRSASLTTFREIKHWLDVFLRRFFATSQFKRSALPNGPKVSSGGSLSPRGDWRAPSDSSPEAWLSAVNDIP